MELKGLGKVTEALAADGKGILAADETIGARFGLDQFSSSTSTIRVGSSRVGPDSYRPRRWPNTRVPKLLKSLVDEDGIVEVDGRQSVFLAPIVLGVLPFRLVATFGQQVHGADK